MVNLYIDESGSITQTNTEHNKYFVIGIVVPRDTDRVRKLYSQFVERNLSRMRALEKAHAIFDTNGKFKELKGNAFDATLKERFLNHFCRFDALRVFYIQAALGIGGIRQELHIQYTNAGNASENCCAEIGAAFRRIAKARNRRNCTKRQY